MGLTLILLFLYLEKINNDDLDKYNKSSGYYNDICYTANTEHNTDIILSDRKQEYVDKNMSICEINCDFIFYNSEENKAICSCGIKTEIPFMSNIKFDKNILLESFTDVKNFMNIKILSCYEIVFKKNNLLRNYGFFIFSGFIFIDIICFFLFCCKYYKKLILILQKLRLNMVNNKRIPFANNINNFLGKKRIKNNINNNILKSKEKKIIKKKSNVLNKDNIKKKNKEYINNNPKKNIKKKNTPKTKEIRLDNKEKKNRLIPEFKININNNSNNKSNLFLIKNNNKKKNNNNNINNKKKAQNINNNKSNKKIILPIKLITSELNSLEFKEALEKDKRTYIQYYISLLKTNHSLLYIFHSDDYNSTIIKISIFIFNL
jgi:hypothetical protein